ncbi:MAG: hypothetical protein WD767_14930 [Alphaproteobacteria bacterium]
MFCRRPASSFGWTAVVCIAALSGLAGCDQIAGLFPSSGDSAKTAEAEARSFARRPSPAERLDDSAARKAFMVEAPETGVDLGWGWSVDRGQPIPTECVAFDIADDPAQETTVSISETRDSHSLSRSMGISSSVSVNAIAYEASGKASFAKSTKITAFSTTYVVRAEVRNGAHYAAPKDPGRGRHLGRAVTLTAAAAALARRDLAAFQQACGEGFVSAAMRGAEAFAVIDIATRSKTTKESVKTEVSGSGWGVKVDAAFSAASSSGSDSSKNTISFYQAGGSGNPLPKDADGIKKRIENLAQDALDAGKLYALQITPYQVLENFPSGEELTADAGEVDEIAAAWGLYRTLHDDIGAVFAEPTGFTLPVADCTGKTRPAECEIAFRPLTGAPLVADEGIGGVSALEVLGVFQDIALGALDRVELGAATCLEADENCAFDPAALRSSYAVRTGLPLPSGWLQGDDATNQVKLHDAHAAFHLRDAARGRCEISSLELGCIANAELGRWAARTGFVPVAAADRDGFNRAIAALGEMPHFTGDPDRPDALTLWVPPANLRAAQAAVADSG